MTAPTTRPEAGPSATVVPLISLPARHQARAYCGPLHGMSWPLADAEPPERVDLGGSDSVHPYHLVRHPRTGRPARDHRGQYAYVPAPVSALRPGSRRP